MHLFYLISLSARYIEPSSKENLETFKIYISHYRGTSAVSEEVLVTK
jgi:hypothetical protein